MDEVNSLLTVVRKQKGYSMRKLARESGLSANCISMIETKKVSPSFQTVSKLFNSMGLRLELVVKPIQE
jgi:DNA-binding phage protein